MILTIFLDFSLMFISEYLKRRERDSNPRNAFDVYTLSRRASSATRAPLLGLGNSCWAMRGLYMFAADLHSGIGRKSNTIFS